jgi:hypothetical protein
MSKVISEAKMQLLVREMIREELELAIVQEGLWDNLKGGVKKLSAWVTQKFSQAAAAWSQQITQKLGTIEGARSEAKLVFDALNAGVKETGENITLDKNLQAAKELSASAANANAVVDADMQSGVLNKVQQSNTKQEGRYLPDVYLVLNEKIVEPSGKKKLNEDFGISAALGVGLAVMGGLPLLFKGLAKLATVLGATETAKLMTKAEHVTHAFEQKTIDFVMPDRLAYAVYKFLQTKGLKMTPELLQFEGFKKDPVMAKVKTLVYKAVLIYFAINGVVGALKAGFSLLGFVEGTATTVKGIELAKGAAEVAKIVNGG